MIDPIDEINDDWLRRLAEKRPKAKLAAITELRRKFNPNWASEPREHGMWTTGGGTSLDEKTGPRPRFQSGGSVETAGPLSSYPPAFQQKVLDRAKEIGLTQQSIRENMRPYFERSADGPHATADRYWYTTVNQFGEHLGQRFGVPPRQVYGVIASLSPQRPWEGTSNNNQVATTATFQYIADDPVAHVTQDEADRYNSNSSKSAYTRKLIGDDIAEYGALQPGDYKVSELSDVKAAALSNTFATEDGDKRYPIGGASGIGVTYTAIRIARG